MPIQGYRKMTEPVVTPYGRNSKLATYQSVSVHGGVANADPHAMVQMLMDAAAERISIGRGCIERGERIRQASVLHSCVMIIGELRGSLNLNEGGPLARNLSDLYQYMIDKLIVGNATSDPNCLIEVSRLLEEVRGAWIAIGPEVRNQRKPAPAPAKAVAEPA